MQGFLNLNKPAGWTSHDCVAKVRRLLRLKRVGHGGTLDPAATGVLPIALGKATRLLQYMQQDKAYKATVRLGVRTTTDDLEGEVIATQSAAQLTLELVKGLLKQFEGKIQQVPPMYSAIQIKGKRLYDLARAGEVVEVPERTVEVEKIEVLDWRGGEFPEIDLAIACGPGTYIRSIARDLGDALETGGVLAALTRTRSSGFDLADSLTLEELTEQLEQSLFQPVSPSVGLGHLPSVTLSADQARRWCLGQRISGDDTLETPTIPLQVYHEDGSFLGIGKVISSTSGVLLAPQMVFV
ncbi:tRNA pseudouridine(55) synthase TruB [Moorena sp. SIO2C4]|uniref:tRNA pseudouridine(55) synthase TruB n=1 Tax=Moorena TaxID=1155738 RepID=UPI0005C906BE|nr:MULTISPECIES: tRNA pseudouridine(55) synthase TruB [unclassified Moorena]NEQ12905.1 tRNA pseudouridine(55) synthase TruB [Moorena sp. SIO3E2]OLT69097.1 tRNA pseudouridine(55) synthase TruB [Moorena producens 3L]NEP32336.1 tRNA pseudouridine(55) synthase TruB [Moorena sp. SIO3B2]NEP67453.1 tRNA pseudouridine(55) synthase TruB [Moorena sp. SIO3A5]NEQ06436.1 tRNA pseudouridine(55) synthase TruB [Moorena sp. SIO4E2]